MSSKKRTLSRRKETEAISALRNYCATQNLVFQAEPREDYGVDCYIEVALEDRPLNFLVGIQSRAGRSHRRKAALKADFKIDLRPTDIQYWLAANYPIVLMYFDDVSKEQYFKHIQDEWERSDRKDSQYVTISESDRVMGENLVVATDDDTIFIENNCLAPAEFFYAGRYFVDRALRNLAAISRIGDRFFDRPPAHFQIVHPYTSE